MCVSDFTYECVYPIGTYYHSFSVPIVNGNSADEYNIKLRIEDVDTGQAVYDSSSDNGPFVLAANEEAQANWSNPYNSWYDGHTYNLTFYATLTEDNQQTGNSRHLEIQFFDNIDVAILSNATSESRLESVKGDLEAMGKTYTQFQVDDWDEYATPDWLEHYDKVLLPWQTNNNVYYGDYYEMLGQSRESDGLSVTETLEDYMTGGGTVQMHLGPYKDEYQPNRLPFGMDIVMRDQVSADVDNRIHYSSLDIVDQYHPILNNVNPLAFSGINGGSHIALAGLDTAQVQVTQMPQVCGGRISDPTGTFHTLMRDSEYETQSLLSVCNRGAGGLIVTTIDVEHLTAPESMLSNMLAYHHTPYPVDFGIAGESFELTINGETLSIDPLTGTYSTNYIKSNSELDFSFVTTVEDVVADWTLESGDNEPVTGWDGELMEAGGVSHTQQLDPSIPTLGSFCVDDSSSATGCRIGAEWLLTLYLHDEAGHTRMTYIRLATDDTLADMFRPIADVTMIQNEITDENVILDGTKTVAGVDWPIYRARLSDTGDLSISFDARASYDPDAPEGSTGIELYEWKVFYDYPWDSSDPTLEGHVFQIPAAAGGEEWTYVFRNLTTSPDGNLENQIRVELIVYDKAGKQSEKHRMYFIIAKTDPIVEFTNPDPNENQEDDLVTITGILVSGAEFGDVVIEVALTGAVLDYTPTQKVTQKTNGKYDATGLLSDSQQFTMTLDISDLYQEVGVVATIYVKIKEGESYLSYQEIHITLVPRILDDDNDGVTNQNDDCPNGITGWKSSLETDFDNDGCKDVSEDDDDDNDGYLDWDDAFSLDAEEWLDTDSDGVGNNADGDDDGDSWSDTEEEDCLTESLNVSSVPTDTDLDGLCNVVDDDDDNDGWDDVMDIRPLDPTIQTEWDILRDYIPWALASIILIVSLSTLIVLRKRRLRVDSVPEKKVENSAMEDYVQQMIAMGHPEDYARNYAMQFADQFEPQSKN